MKVKLKQKKQVNEVVELLAGVAIAGLLMFLAKKLFAPLAMSVAPAAKQVDKSLDKVNDVLEQDGSPEAMSVAEKLLQARQKLATTLNEIDKMLSKRETTGNLSERPSALADKAIKEYLRVVDPIIQNNNLDEETKKELAHTWTKAKSQINLFQNCDVYYLLCSTTDPESLYAKVIKPKGLTSFFDNKKEWYKFVEILQKNVIFSQIPAE